VAIRNAVLTGRLDVRVGLPLLAPEHAALWRERIEVTERSRPRDFTRNGWVVEAFQGAWSAIHFTSSAVGRDTDTVAAIAGGLLGAAYGYTAVPFEWRRHLQAGRDSAPGT
jgi:ADP-ribosyl-[dinitrogen reductase] hydrolase